MSRVTKHGAFVKSLLHKRRISRRQSETFPNFFGISRQGRGKIRIAGRYYGRNTSVIRAEAPISTSGIRRHASPYFMTPGPRAILSSRERRRNARAFFLVRDHLGETDAAVANGRNLVLALKSSRAGRIIARGVFWRAERSHPGWQDAR